MTITIIILIIIIIMSQHREAELFSQLAGADGKVHEAQCCERAMEAGLCNGPKEWRAVWARLCQGAMVHPSKGLDLPHFRRACRKGLTPEEVRRLHVQ